MQVSTYQRHRYVLHFAKERGKTGKSTTRMEDTIMSIMLTRYVVSGADLSMIPLSRAVALGCVLFVLDGKGVLLSI